MEESYKCDLCGKRCAASMLNAWREQVICDYCLDAENGELEYIAREDKYIDHIDTLINESREDREEQE
jgi:hypothetical protein